MFVLVGAGGLAAVAQLGLIAKSFGIANAGFDLRRDASALIYALSQQHHERHHTAAARWVSIESARDDDVRRVHGRGARHLRADGVGPFAGCVRAASGSCSSRGVRSTASSIDDARSLRAEVRDDELRMLTPRRVPPRSSFRWRASSARRPAIGGGAQRTRSSTSSPP